jgi:hypothetical protein
MHTIADFGKDPARQHAARTFAGYELSRELVSRRFAALHTFGHHRSYLIERVHATSRVNYRTGGYAHRQVGALPGRTGTHRAAYDDKVVIGQASFHRQQQLNSCRLTRSLQPVQCAGRKSANDCYVMDSADSSIEDRGPQPLPIRQRAGGR